MMKFFFKIMISCFVVYTMPCYGQDTHRKKEVGVHGGPLGMTYLDLINGRLVGIDRPVLPGYAFGGYFKYSFKETFGLAVELNYETKGTMVKDPLKVNVARRGYLTLPITLNIQLNRSNHYQPIFLNVGYYVGYLLNEMYRVEVRGHTFKGKSDISDQKHLDFGLVTGLGARFPLTDQLNFLVELRNNLGLIDIFKTSTKTETFGLQLGLTYKL